MLQKVYLESWWSVSIRSMCRHIRVVSNKHNIGEMFVLTLILLFYFMHYLFTY